MKLLFEKNDSQIVTVKISHEEKVQSFSYITMLKGLIDYGSVGDAEIIGDFSESEKTSITLMVKNLNGCIPAKDVPLSSNSPSDEQDIMPAGETKH